MGLEYRDTYYQQRLTPLEILYEERHLERLYEADDVNSQFVQSVVCEEFEKQLHDAITQKVVMNGSVVPLIEKSKHDAIKDRVSKIHKIFYSGDPLTNLEIDIERMYVNEKHEKMAAYSKRKSLRYKVRWTISDLNKHQDQINYRMNEPEYFGTAKPKFAPLDLDNALECMYTHMDILKTSKLRRALSWMTDTRAF
jgi:hypothetical protein